MSYSQETEYKIKVDVFVFNGFHTWKIDLYRERAASLVTSGVCEGIPHQSRPEHETLSR